MIILNKHILTSHKLRSIVASPDKEIINRLNDYSFLTWRRKRIGPSDSYTLQNNVVPTPILHLLISPKKPPAPKNLSKSKDKASLENI